MTYDDFVESVKNELNKRNILYAHEIVQKNGKGHDALILNIKNNVEHINISPTLYLESIYEDDHEGLKINKVIDEVIGEYYKQEQKVTHFVTLMKKFETVTPYLNFKLINKDRNEEYVQKKGCLYKEFLDLYIVPIVSYDIYIVEITHSIMSGWGVSETLIFDACYNGLQNESVMFKSVTEIMPLPRTGEEEIMYVLSNPQITYGASKILIPQVLKTVENTIGGKYWIIPSSTHECIIVPLSADLDPYEIKEFIKEINSSDVISEANFLSNSLYKYTGVLGEEIKIVGEKKGGLNGKN